MCCMRILNFATTNLLLFTANRFAYVHFINVLREKIGHKGIWENLCPKKGYAVRGTEINVSLKTYVLF